MKTLTFEQMGKIDGGFFPDVVCGDLWTPPECEGYNPWGWGGIVIAFPLLNVLL
jgi:hypothetical protein